MFLTTTSNYKITVFFIFIFCFQKTAKALQQVDQIQTCLKEAMVSPSVVHFESAINLQSPTRRKNNSHHDTIIQIPRTQNEA